MKHQKYYDCINWNVQNNCFHIRITLDITLIKTSDEKLFYTLKIVMLSTRARTKIVQVLIIIVRNLIINSMNITLNTNKLINNTIIYIHLM